MGRNIYLPVSLPPSQAEFAKGPAWGIVQAFFPIAGILLQSLSCSSQAMPRITPKSVNQDGIFLLEIRCASADRPLKTPAMQCARSPAHSNPETHVVSNNSHKFYEIMCS